MTYTAADGLRYLFIDFNAFFAGVEQHDDPALRGRPVIVTPLKSDHTMAIAASYEARPFGITRGTKVFEARDLCPDIAVRPARHDRYVQVHKQLMAEIERHLPLAKVYSIDEAAFRLSPSEARAPQALAIGAQIMEGIRNNVGPALRASIGVAQTRLLAKLAAESNKPDGMTALSPQDLPGKLVDIALRDIPGIGSGVAARLAKCGITDFMGLWNLSPKQARAIWRSVQGERFWYGLHGYEVDEPETKKSTLGHSRVLTGGFDVPDKARIVARALLLKAASRLRHHELYASRLSLGVKIRPDGRWEGSAAGVPSQDSYRFLHDLDALWERFLSSQLDGVHGLKLRSVTVYLHGLAHGHAAAVQQGDLFAERVRDEKAEKRARLWRAIDKINADPDRKFARLAGKDTSLPREICDTPDRHVMLARQQDLDLNYLGTKIAFSRVPDEVEFLY